MPTGPPTFPTTPTASTTTVKAVRNLMSHTNNHNKLKYHQKYHEDDNPLLINLIIFYDPPQSNNPNNLYDLNDPRNPNNPGNLNILMTLIT